MLNDLGSRTEFFSVRGKTLHFCNHCDYCLQHQKCVIDDDMGLLGSLIKDARGLVIATPVYNGGVSAQIKVIMDRCRSFVASDRNFFKFKVGMAIAVGGDRMGGQELALQQIITFYLLNGFLPVSGGFFGANLGATFWSKDTLEAVKTDEEGFRTLNKTVKAFSEILKKLK